MESSGSTSSGLKAMLITFGPFRMTHGGLAVRALRVTSDLRACGVDVSVVSVGEDDHTRLRDLPHEGDSEKVVCLSSMSSVKWAIQLVYYERHFRRHGHVIVGESALLLLPILAFTKLPMILDANGCQTAHYAMRSKTIANLLKRSIWRSIEHLVLWRCLAVVAVSEPEARRWMTVFPKYSRKVQIVEHCPIISRQPSPFTESHAGRRDGLNLNDGCRYIVFVGSNSKHNIDAAVWCIRRLAPELPPNTYLVLAGKGSDVLVSTEGSPERVLGLGFVDDIDEIIRGASICIAPIETGEGTETKVLHYVALGGLVAATTLALEGIEDAPGCMTSELDEFVGLVVSMLNHQESAHEKSVRQSSQADWVNKYTAPERTQGQWMKILDVL